MAKKQTPQLDLFAQTAESKRRNQRIMDRMVPNEPSIVWPSANIPSFDCPACGEKHEQMGHGVVWPEGLPYQCFGSGKVLHLRGSKMEIRNERGLSKERDGGRAAGRKAGARVQGAGVRRKSR